MSVDEYIKKHKIHTHRYAETRKRFEIDMFEYNKLTKEQKHQFTWLRRNIARTRMLQVSVYNNGKRLADGAAVYDRTIFLDMPEMRNWRDRKRFLGLVSQLEQMTQVQIDDIVYFVDSVLTSKEDEKIAYGFHNNLFKTVSFLD